VQLTTQFQFLEGFGQFSPGCTYILISHVKAENRVAIVHLRKVSAVDLIFLNREIFEKAIDDGIIKAIDEQATLPPWICYTEAASQRSMQALKDKHTDRIKKSMKLIQKLSFIWKNLINSPDPVFEINQAIRNEATQQKLNINLTRVRAQLLTFIAFGQNEAALLPSVVLHS